MGANLRVAKKREKLILGELETLASLDQLRIGIKMRLKGK